MTIAGACEFAKELAPEDPSERNWYHSKAVDESLLFCKRNRLASNLTELTVSEKLRVRRSVVMSRSKLVKEGVVISC